MTVTNCSYTLFNGSFMNQTCSVPYPYCCISTGSSYCSDSSCFATEKVVDISGIVFWSVLGGLFFISVFVVTMTYVICFMRKPRGCGTQDPLEELFRETVIESETTRTITSSRIRPGVSHRSTSIDMCQSEVNSKMCQRQTPHRHMFTKPQDPVHICVPCRNTASIDQRVIVGRRTEKSLQKLSKHANVPSSLPRVVD
ncbi:hypothetical protein ACJMK2_016914 [Sinanodonta woodiana]|uniref:Uncharacterized protein n=1 Tax=Sinanodonta woodiana TaxID=1069815 RepID=A0ABD3UX87_SINWO